MENGNGDEVAAFDCDYAIGIEISEVASDTLEIDTTGQRTFFLFIEFVDFGQFLLKFFAV